MKPKELKERPPLFKKFKTYSAAEIIAAGGATEFAKLTGHDPKKLYHLEGEPISQEEFEAALKELERK
ncbi:hypothetical protein [Spirosoma spitsbergense]|jgi:hypothetical protein|uniref:hypothetical protein n=1 Tax=Spirosoma spitsbergense TaxID=431554 RepID=UPI00037DE2DC|nr:hypothetical protein [Spirosoma spitsbergense]